LTDYQSEIHRPKRKKEEDKIVTLRRTINNPSISQLIKTEPS